ncbi:MAG: hypothetical protein ACJ8R9_21395 [Steroidobacteraceae bacterium]
MPICPVGTATWGAGGDEESGGPAAGSVVGAAGDAGGEVAFIAGGGVGPTAETACGGGAVGPTAEAACVGAAVGPPAEAACVGIAVVPAAGAAAVGAGADVGADTPPGSEAATGLATGVGCGTAAVEPGNVAAEAVPGTVPGAEAPNDVVIEGDTDNAAAGAEPIDAAANVPGRTEAVPTGGEPGKPVADAEVGAGGPTTTAGAASSAAEVCGGAAAGAGSGGEGEVEGVAPTGAPAFSTGITSPGSFTTS